MAINLQKRDGSVKRTVYLEFNKKRGHRVVFSENGNVHTLKGVGYEADVKVANSQMQQAVRMMRTMGDFIRC